METLNNIGMDSSYAENSCIQQNIRNFFTKNIIEAVEIYSKELDQSQGSINIIDYGCADGVNDSVLFQQIVDCIRQNSQQTICIYLSDLSSQNMTIAIENVRSRVKGDKIFIYGTPGSFYECLFPENFADIIICLNSTPWIPEVIPNKKSFKLWLPSKEQDQTSYSTFDSRFMAASEKYLRQFFDSRLKELKVKGLLCTNIALFEDSDTEEALLRQTFVHDYWNTMQTALKKHLQEEEIPNMNLPIVVRRPYQVNAILESYDKFRPTYAQICAVPNILGQTDPLHPNWAQTCRQVTKFYEGFGKSYYLKVLGSAGINQEKVTDVIKDFYEGLEQYLMNQTGPRQKDDVGYYLILAKDD